MYTNIPWRDAVDLATSRLIHKKWHYNGLEPKHILPLLDAVLSNGYFTFNFKVFKQIRGLPMGSSISAILAIIYVDEIEKQALKVFGLHNVSVYFRYVDDIFISLKDEEAADNALHIFNSVNENIQFTIEKPENDQLSYLDFTINNEEQPPVFRFYRKKARKDVFVNFHSAIANSQKAKIIQNEISRIKARCSKNVDYIEEAYKFRSVLASNDYSEKFLKSNFDRFINKKTVIRNQKSIKISKNKIFLKTPFVNESFYNSMRSIFVKINKKFNTNFIPYSQPRSLKSILNFKILHDLPKQKCVLKNCVINNIEKCYKSMIVYSLYCNHCGNTYIGSTIRALHIRIREHIIFQKTSSVYQHVRSCHADISIEVDVLAQADCEKQLRSIEAGFIKKLKPEINNKEENNDFIFLF
jgi:hypothetical protein